MMKFDDDRALEYLLARGWALAPGGVLVPPIMYHSGWTKEENNALGVLIDDDWDYMCADLIRDRMRLRLAVRHQMDWRWQTFYGQQGLLILARRDHFCLRVFACP